jgi:predicted TPR repeat methyltransferase
MTEPSADSRLDRAKARFFEGLKCFHDGRFDAAEQHFLAALEAVPGRVSTLINLAATQLQLAQPEAALANADAALAAEPDSAEAWLHRATALQQLSRLEDALHGFDRLLEIDDHLPEGWLRRAQTLGRLGRHAEALASFDRVLALEPNHVEAWSGRGSMQRELHRLAEAAQSFREALRHGADHDLHAYYLASVEGLGAPPAAPRAYVQTLFDDYADVFDAHLVGTLGYSAHTQLVDGLVALARGPYENGIDVGCGTGLCGPLVRPLTRHLTGLDLSPRMLRKASELGVYDRLEHADAAEYLSRDGAPVDLVVAADVFIYVGALEAMFAAVDRRMKRGVFCFSVEVLPPGRGDFGLLASLRYAHSQSYLQRLASAHGFDLILEKLAQVRREQRTPVHGLFVYLGKNAA